MQTMLMRAGRLLAGGGRWSLCCLLLCLSACSSYAPPAALLQMSRGELLARLGPPETVRLLDAGTRLEFPSGPFGKQTWFVDLDGQDRVSRVEQVLNEPSFSRIKPGMAQDAVRQLLGRPSEVQALGRSRGQVWRYRYENYLCQWFLVELTLEQTVRSTGYGQPPECEDRSDDLWRRMMPPN
jgi:hypothetical protein